MAKTGQHLKVQRFGDNALGITLEGNPEKPEPIYFRVAFPFGDVDIVRLDDGRYWIHLRTNRADEGAVLCDDAPIGQIQDARIDISGRHSADVNCGELSDPNVYHVAFLVGRKTRCNRDQT